MNDLDASPACRRHELSFGWTVSVTDGPAPFEVDAVPAIVPGSFVADLHNAGLAADPYLDRNEHELAWTGEVDVAYRTAFSWSASHAQRVDLVAASLDTVATIVLNGRHVARTANQHRSWRFDVTDALVEGENALEIRFDAPLRSAREAAEVLGDLPVGGNELPYNAIRKMACNFGWDWGPELLTSGIAGPIGLEEWSGARLAEVRPQVTVDGADTDAPSAAVALAVDCERADLLDTSALRVDAALLDPDGVEVDAASVGAADDDQGLALALDVPAPRLWWPRGYGEQPLYTVRVELRDADGTLLATRTHRVGLRSAGVVEEADDIGMSFTVTVNDRPILAKGANWIPDDCFTGRLTPSDYAASVGDAVDAGMNMLRVWGGGLYESEHLYDLCDQLGIMVWQDFPTACAAYSEREPLRSELEAEARENIVRLAWHPALVHWNGGNENVEGYLFWGFQKRMPEGDPGWGDHYFTDLFPSLLAELDPTRSYTPNSPFSRPKVDDPRNPDYGTIHNWTAWGSLEDNDYERYRDSVPRFSAEFGYQGPANYATVERMVSERPLRADSETMLSHQKALGGQGRIEAGYRKHLPEPEGFDDYHFTAQLNQARALTCGIGHYRSHWPVCGGTLVWQLNDCWPVTSWAAVDGDRRRKLLWYALRDIYEPVLVTVQPRGEGIAVSVGNDTAAPLATTARLRRQDHAGAVLAETSLDVAVPARSVATLPVPAELAAPDDAAREVLVVELDGHARIGRGARTVHFFAEDKDSALVGGAFAASARRAEDGVEIAVTATGTVRDLCVLADKVDPSAVAERQLVTLLPGEGAVLRVAAPECADAEAFLAPTVLLSANDLVERARARAA